MSNNSWSPTQRYSFSGARDKWKCSLWNILLYLEFITFTLPNCYHCPLRSNWVNKVRVWYTCSYIVEFKKVNECMYTLGGYFKTTLARAQKHLGKRLLNNAWKKNTAKSWRDKKGSLFQIGHSVRQPHLQFVLMHITSYWVKRHPHKWVWIEISVYLYTIKLYICIYIYI